MTYLRAKNIAKRLDMSESTVWRLVKSGVLPKPIKLTPRTTVFDVAAVDAAIEALRNGGVVA